MEIAKVPQLGQIVKILRGRDSGDYAVIVGLVDQRSVLIADGRTRKFDHPKKKNLLHLELQSETSDIVVNSLMETGRVTNGKLRHALAKYLPS
ncbi:50S ribosomal protein L14e [compost metagenome]